MNNRILGRVGNGRRCCEQVAPAVERVSARSAFLMGCIAGAIATIAGIVAILEWCAP